MLRVEHSNTCEYLCAASKNVTFFSRRGELFFDTPENILFLCARKNVTFCSKHSRSTKSEYFGAVHKTVSIFVVSQKLQISQPPSVVVPVHFFIVLESVLGSVIGSVLGSVLELVSG
jgi:hypothetical protein